MTFVSLCDIIYCAESSGLNWGVSVRTPLGSHGIPVCFRMPLRCPSNHVSFRNQLVCLFGALIQLHHIKGFKSCALLQVTMLRCRYWKVTLYFFVTLIFLFFVYWIILLTTKLFIEYQNIYWNQVLNCNYSVIQTILATTILAILIKLNT